jgi:hypothetical protein
MKRSIAMTAIDAGRRLPPLRSRGRGLVLAALVLAAFAPSVVGPPLWDDVNLIAASEALKNPLDALRPYSLGLRNLPQGLGAHFWRPLVTASLWGEARVAAALGVGATGLHHAVQCVWHAAAAWLVWRLLCRLAPTDERADRWSAAAWWAALAWAVAPLKAENVAWISGRGDVMGWTLVLIGAELALVCRRWISRALLAALFTGLALLCKEVWIAAPVLWLVLGRDRAAELSPRSLGRPELVGSIAAAAAYAVVRSTLVGAARGGGAPLFASLGFFDRLTMPLETVGYAAFALATPWSPRFLRGPWAFKSPGELVPDVWAGGLGLVVVLVAVVLWLKAARARDALVLIAAPLLPVLNVIPTGLEARLSDRYLYVPFLGVVLAILSAAGAWSARLPARPVRGRAWWAAGAGILAVLAPQRRIHEFTHPAELWAHEAARSHPPASILVQHARAEEIAGHLRPARDAWLRVARRYVDLGFDEGLPYALNAARLETFASGARGPAMQAYAAALACLRSGTPRDAVVPFSDGSGAVRIPCQTPEAELFRSTKTAMLDAEIARVRRRLEECGGTDPHIPP